MGIKAINAILEKCAADLAKEIKDSNVEEVYDFVYNSIGLSDELYYMIIDSLDLNLDEAEEYASAQ